MTGLQPKPGFDPSRLKWSAPDDRVSQNCGYCGALIGEETIPLRMFSDDGWATQFCDQCMRDWWGMK